MPVGACPNYGTHKMIMQGQGGAIDTNDPNKKRVIFTGSWFKCGCGERVVCEGYPENGGTLGQYVTEGGIVQALSIGSWMSTFEVDPDAVYEDYNSSTILSAASLNVG